jgi:hypothetical protein
MTKKQQPTFADTPPTIIIEHDVYEKVNFWVRQHKQEVSGMGLIEIHEKKIYVVEAFLLDQVTSSGDTEFDGEALGKLTNEVYQNYDANDVDRRELRWWWHSHPMNGWSGTDRKAFATLGKQIIEGHDNYVTGTVFYQGKGGIIRSALYQTGPICDAFIDNLPTYITKRPLHAYEEEWKKEFDEKVKNKPLDIAWDETITVGKSSKQKAAWSNPLFQYL